MEGNRRGWITDTISALGRTIKICIQDSRVALSPAGRSMSVRPVLEYMRRFDPQDHSHFALDQRISVTTQVFPGKHVYVLRRSVFGTTLFDNGSANYHGPPGILRIDHGHSDSWISINVFRFEVTHDGID